MDLIFQKIEQIFSKMKSINYLVCFKIFCSIIFILSLLIVKIYLQDKKIFTPKIDYDNSITSLACSIQKYFELNPLHKTLPYIDDLFSEKKPENVILLIIDGLGSKIMDKILSKNDFLIKNRLTEIYSVFPPTTASCINSIKKGLNPSEHGWLGTSIYIPPIDKIIQLYCGEEKGKFKIDEDYKLIKDKYYFNTKTIVELINKQKKYILNLII